MVATARPGSAVGFTPWELRRLRALRSPVGIQRALDRMPYTMSHLPLYVPKRIEDGGRYGYGTWSAFGFIIHDLTDIKNPKAIGRFEKVIAVLMLLGIGTIVLFDSRSSSPDGVWQATWQSGLSRAALLGLAFLFLGLLPGAAGRRRMLLTSLLMLVFWLDLVTHSRTQNPVANRAIPSRER